MFAPASLVMLALAACIAGGPADPFCDFCAYPEIWKYIDVRKFSFKPHLHEVSKLKMYMEDVIS
jgi:hypothetical protein